MLDLAAIPLTPSLCERITVQVRDACYREGYGGRFFGLPENAAKRFVDPAMSQAWRDGWQAADRAILVERVARYLDRVDATADGASRRAVAKLLGTEPDDDAVTRLLAQARQRQQTRRGPRPV